MFPFLKRSGREPFCTVTGVANRLLFLAAQPIFKKKTAACRDCSFCHTISAYMILHLTMVHISWSFLPAYMHALYSNMSFSSLHFPFDYLYYNRNTCSDEYLPQFISPPIEVGEFLLAYVKNCTRRCSHSHVPFFKNVIIQYIVPLVSTSIESHFSIL